MMINAYIIADYTNKDINIVLRECVDREHAKVYWKVNDEVYSRYMKAVERFEDLAEFYDKEVKA